MKSLLTPGSALRAQARTCIFFQNFLEAQSGRIDSQHGYLHLDDGRAVRLVATQPGVLRIAQGRNPGDVWLCRHKKRSARGRVFRQPGRGPDPAGRAAGADRNLCAGRCGNCPFQLVTASAGSAMPGRRPRSLGYADPAAGRKVCVGIALLGAASVGLAAFPGVIIWRCPAICHPH